MLQMRPLAALCVLVFLSLSQARAEPTPPAALQATVPEGGLIKFDVYRKGNRIGTHSLKFTHEDDLLKVDVDVKFKVKFLFVTVYKFRQESTEVWSNGRLMAVESETKQNGKNWRLKAQCDTDETRVELNGDERVIPPDLLPTSYWNAGIVTQSQLLNTQFGSAVDVDVTSHGADVVTAVGRSVEAMRYKVNAMVAETGQPVNVDIWYDMRGELLKLQFVAKDGSVVEYRRVA